MIIVRKLEVDGYEDVRKIEAPRFRAWIAVHDTTLGPALGGCRVRPYASEQEALSDVLRLAEAMTLKSSLAGLPLGGGKMVVQADPRQIDEEMLRGIAMAVETFGGRYIVAEDMGTTPSHMAVISRWTKHVAHSHEGGNPAPATAFGVLVGMDAWSLHRDGRPVGSHTTVAVQGTGAVGSRLVSMLADRGVRLIVADVDVIRAKEVAASVSGRTEVEVVTPDRVLETECDILAPCAVGSVVDGRRARTIRCRAVVGSANNQLAAPGVLDILGERGIDYLPDFLVNAGGVCHVWFESGVRSCVYEVAALIHGIQARALEVLRRADAGEGTTHEIAVRMAMDRIRRHRPGGTASVDVTVRG